MVRLLALNGLRNNHLEAEMILLSPDIPAQHPATNQTDGLETVEEVSGILVVQPNTRRE